MSLHRICCCNPALWLPFGTGMDGDVRAAVAYAGGLVAVGDFSTAGGVTVRGVAFWNGSAWSALGGGVGLDGTGTGANAVAVYGGNLYIGGSFSSVNGVSAPNIAMWNGSAWSSLGAGTSDRVQALYVYGADLVVGGEFFSAGGVGVFGIAKWNGSTWSDFSNGNTTTLPVVGFAEYGGSLYMCGGSTDLVQVWSGSAWSSVGAAAIGLGGIALSLATFDGNLYAGGSMSEIDSVSVNHLGSYNGSTWSPVGTANSAIQALHIWNSLLVTAGNYTSPANHVARYNGTSFTNFGDGLNGAVLGLTTYNGYLVAGGAFTASGALTRNRIAYWSIPETP